MAAELFGGSLQLLSVDAFARLRLPYRPGVPDGYSYPVGAMKGLSARPEEWRTVFEQWSGSVQLEVSAKSQGAMPAGIAIEISVYAEGYAGSRPVLTVKEVWIPWASIVAHKTLQSTQLRHLIASLVKANVPSLNVLTVGPLPTVAELNDERLSAAWEDCVEVASSALAFAGGRGANVIFWSLEPVHLDRNAKVSANERTGAESIKSKTSDLQVIQESEPISIDRDGSEGGDGGEVALFIGYGAAGPPNAG
jgi:hypothetical protein